MLKGSWRTTATGWVALGIGLLTAVQALLGSAEMQELIESGVAVAVGLGLISARDNRVSSEEAGAK